jgi:hypothetical protein
MEVFGKFVSFSGCSLYMYGTQQQQQQQQQEGKFLSVLFVVVLLCGQSCLSREGSENRYIIYLSPIFLLLHLFDKGSFVPKVPSIRARSCTTVHARKAIHCSAQS